MCPFVSADVRGGGRLRDEPKECLRRRLTNMACKFLKFVYYSGFRIRKARVRKCNRFPRQKGDHGPRRSMRRPRKLGTRTWHRRIRLTCLHPCCTQFRSRDDSFGRLQLCNLSHTTDCMEVCTNRIIVTSQMNYHVIWIGWQQGCKHVSRIGLYITYTFMLLFIHLHMNRRKLY